MTIHCTEDFPQINNVETIIFHQNNSKPYIQFRVKGEPFSKRVSFANVSMITE